MAINSNERDCNCVVPTTAISIKELNLCPECMMNLTTLNLWSTNLSILPQYVGDFENLVKMDLSYNNLSKLPMSLVGLQNLTDLDLSGNRFTRIPPCLIHGMASLTSLSLSRNNLLNINDTMPLCIEQLVSLDISRNSQLNILPKWLWSVECVALESLNISFTDCLQRIDLVPKFYDQGIANCLTSLNITNTNAKVRRLDFIRYLKNIKSITMGNLYSRNNVKSNYFERVPQVFNYKYKSLINISMINVKLSSFEKNDYFVIQNVQTVNFSNNSIKLLPNSFSQLTSLEVCDLSQNNIVSIPDTFRNLKNLKSLYLNNNWLRAFPDILNDLTNLKFLDLYFNRLVGFPSWNINILSIDLEQNEFSTDNMLHIKDYSTLLNNLRSTVHQIRLVGPKFTEKNVDLNFSSNNFEHALNRETNCSPNLHVPSTSYCHEQNQEAAMAKNVDDYTSYYVPEE